MDVMYAMENSDHPVRLSCKVRKDGSITGDIATRDQFKQLDEFIIGLLGKMVDEIASGVVAPNPYSRGSSHDACRYCPYGSICHSATVADRRNYKTVSAQRFWDEIEKEMSKHG
jgi:ATP-dependent helicase/DNAse subunit B